MFPVKTSIKFQHLFAGNRVGNPMNRFILISCLIFSAATHAVEFSVGAGYQSHDASWKTDNPAFDNRDFSDSGYYFSLGLKNEVGKNNKHLIGVGIDASEILNEQIIGYRAIDYQYAVNDSIRLGGFFGAASIDTGLPQNGYYMGANASYFVTESLSIGAELRHGNGLARDRQEQLGDPVSETEDVPDIFLDFTAFGLQLNWHF